MQDIPTDLDWNILTEIENSEEVERLEMGEVFLSFANDCFWVASLHIFLFILLFSLTLIFNVVLLVD